MPGDSCGQIPLWELSGRSCPACSPALPRDVFCDRVIFDFAAISSTLNPESTFSDVYGTHTMSVGAVRIGYYADPACELNASPNPGYVGQLQLTNLAEELILLQADIPPQPPAGPPPPTSIVKSAT